MVRLYSFFSRQYHKRVVSATRDIKRLFPLGRDLKQNDDTFSWDGNNRHLAVSHSQMCQQRYYYFQWLGPTTGVRDKTIVGAVAGIITVDNNGPNRRSPCPASPRPNNTGFFTLISPEPRRRQGTGHIVLTLNQRLWRWSSVEAALRQRRATRGNWIGWHSSRAVCWL